MARKELLRDIAKFNLDPKKVYVAGKNGNLILKHEKKVMLNELQDDIASELQDQDTNTSKTDKLQQESQDDLAVIVEDKSDELQIQDAVPAQKSKKWPPPRKKKNDVPADDQ